MLTDLSKDSKCIYRSVHIAPSKLCFPNLYGCVTIALPRARQSHTAALMPCGPEPTYPVMARQIMIRDTLGDKVLGEVGRKEKNYS
jgi:hypothetical protein